jgi:hypothetical protein
MYLTHIGTRILILLMYIYFFKWFFCPQNTIVPHEHKKKKPFFPTLDVMILQVIRNECVRFGEHKEVQVS